MYPTCTQPWREVEQHAIGDINYVFFLTVDEGSIIEHWDATDHYTMVSSKCEHFFKTKRTFQLPASNA
jgi:hypothetical protein